MSNKQRPLWASAWVLTLMIELNLLGRTRKNVIALTLPHKSSGDLLLNYLVI